jgi:hypothetical protein
MTNKLSGMSSADSAATMIDSIRVKGPSVRFFIVINLNKYSGIIAMADV